MLKWAIMFALTPMLAVSQSLEFGEVHWDKEDEVKWKLHIKEVIPFEGRSTVEIHDLLESWYLDEFFSKGLGHSYRFHGVSGDFMWQSDTKKPFLINDSLRIHPKSIKCYDCLIAWPNAKLTKRVDGLYRMDLRIKEGKVLLVVADHYILTENSFISDWLLKKHKLVKRPDARIEALELEFERLKESLLEYALNYNERKNKPDELKVPVEKKGVDDW